MAHAASDGRSGKDCNKEDQEKYQVEERDNEKIHEEKEMKHKL